MDISVIIPIYGVERFIEESLMSIFSQTKTARVEFILVNDATKDRSMYIAREVIAKFPELNIITIEHPANKGLAATRATGIERASGEYIIQLDSDDWCEPTMLEDLFNCAKANDSDVVICDFFANFKNKEIYHRQLCSQNNIENVKLLLDGRLLGVLWNKLTRRSLQIDNKITFESGIDMCEDLLVTTELLYHAKKVSYLPKAYLHYRQVGSSISKSIFTDNDITKIYAHIDVLERFIIKYNLTDSFKLFIPYRKLSTMYKHLKLTSNELKKSVAQLYPELNSLIMQNPTMPKYQRIILYQATQGNFIPLNLLRSIRSFAKLLVKNRSQKF